MSSFLWVIVAIGFLVCLVNFPRATLGVSALLIGGAGLFVYLIIMAPAQERERLEQQVSVKATYDIQACDKEYPLLIIVENTSPKTVTHVSWSIDVYRPGYSSNLAGHDNNYETDKIMGPRERWRICYQVPRTLDQKTREISTFDPHFPYQSGALLSYHALTYR
jgi:hypothetical protein